jgi:hypothetical protein
VCDGVVLCAVALLPALRPHAGEAEARATATVVLLSAS